MSKTDELISKLENLKNKVKNQIGKEQPSGFKLLTNYYPKDAKDQIDDIFVIIESEISELKEQIKKEKLWTNDKVIDLVNWYLRLCKIITDSDCRFELENQSVIDSFLNGDDYKLWWSKYNSSVQPDLDCGIYEEKHNPDFIGFDVLKQNSDIRFEQTLKDIKENMSKSSGMREFVISDIQKGIIHPNPLTPSEMRVLNLCCKYLETHSVKENISKSEKDEGLKSILIDLKDGAIDKYAAYDLINVLYAHPVKEITDEEIEKQGGIYEKEYEESIHAPDIPIGAIWANEDFVAGAKWMRKQMSHEAI